MAGEATPWSATAVTPCVAPTPPGERWTRSAYPPSSFVLLMPWLPPGLGFQATRVWFTACQALAQADIPRVGAVLRRDWIYLIPLITIGVADAGKQRGEQRVFALQFQAGQAE